MAKDNEKFSIHKFLRGLDPLNPVAWAKTVIYLLRFLIITAVVGGLVFGFGYWRGKRNAPVKVDMADTLIILKGADGERHELKIKDGTMTFDDRVVKVGDIPSLKPYGIELHPKAIAGIVSTGKPTAGVGLEFAHFYRFNAELLALYQFLGIGVSYDLRLDGPIKIDNSSLGIGIGRDFEENESAVVIYYGIEF